MYDARVGVGFQSTIPITKADADVAGGVKVLMISAGFSRSTSFNQFLLQDIEIEIDIDQVRSNTRWT